MAHNRHIPRYFYPVSDESGRCELALCRICGQVARLSNHRRELTDRRGMFEWEVSEDWRKPTEAEVEAMPVFFEI